MVEIHDPHAIAELRGDERAEEFCGIALGAIPATGRGADATDEGFEAHGGDCQRAREILRSRRETLTPGSWGHS